MIRAIETQYAGCTFRSRLEARWAVFFDALNIRWFYEYEGFELPSGRYVPDFWLPDMKLWLEIKPNSWKGPDARLPELATATGNNVGLMCGEPLYYLTWYDYEYKGHRHSGYDLYNHEGPQPQIYFSGGGEDCPYVFCICLDCGEVGFEFDGRGARVCGHGRECPTPNAKTYIGTISRTISSHEDKGYSPDAKVLLAAADRANKYRFWDPAKKTG